MELLRNFFLAYFLEICRRISELEAAIQRCSVKNVFLEISQNSQENTFFNKVAGLRPIKTETLAEVFSCEFREISKNAFFHRTPLVAASGELDSTNQF